MSNISMTHSHQRFCPLNTRTALNRALRALLAAGLLLAFMPASAEIYRTVDAQGNVTYTDQPPSGTQDRRVIAEKIEITVPNTFRDSTPYEPYEPEGYESAVPGEVEYSLAIVSPAYDQAIRENSGNLTIRTRVNPELQEGHLLRLEMNGSLTGNPVEGGAIYLTNLPRGTHRIRLVVENAKGRRLSESAESVFHLQRFSRLQPGARNQQQARTPRSRVN